MATTSNGCLGVPILWRDGPVLVVNKPARLPTQAPRGIDSLEARIRDYLAQCRGPDPRGNAPYLGIPHRLDRCVSGAVIFATDRKAARKLSRQFENRHIVKIYHALVAGHVSPAAGTWQDFLRKVTDQPHSEVVPENHPEAALAVLHYEVLRQLAQESLLSIRLETGRMHQIRVQAAARGFPVRGDLDYGSTQSFGQSSGDPRDRTIALHACQIGFRHPVSHEDIRVTAPFPPEWAGTLAAME
jgi:RluA family pseudouridine synthase